MGFYFNLATSSLHTDQCTAATNWAQAAQAATATDDSNWQWFETYTEVVLKAIKEGRDLGIYTACAPKADALDKRVLALYDALRG